MRIAMTGASGLIGSALRRDFEASGHTVLRLVRGPEAAAGTLRWDPERGVSDPAALEDLDAVVHLAGEGIASGRWSAARKARIRTSRVHGTGVLATALAGLTHPPRVLVCASATGWYGDRGDEILREDSPPGQGFLADVCREWEAAAAPARGAGMRVAHLRFGIVLDRDGGALAAMLPLFRLGLGSPLGSGRQYMSWITLRDLVRVVAFAIEQKLDGPVNTVAAAVTNRDFTQTLNAALHRWTPPAVPAFLLRLLLGEMADAMLLASQRVESARLRAAGFAFRDAAFEPALRAVLRRNPAP